MHYGLDGPAGQLGFLWLPIYILLEGVLLQIHFNSQTYTVVLLWGKNISFLEVKTYLFNQQKILTYTAHNTM